MTGKYILNEQGEPVEEKDLMKWGKWVEEHNMDRVLKQDEVQKEPRIFVSTVFLGLNHNDYDGPPILWETKIFGGPQDEWTARYNSKRAATEGHEAALKIALTPKSDETPKV